MQNRKKLLHESNLYAIPTGVPNMQPPTENIQGGIGYVSVGVYTASRALPVPNAIVTVYHTDEFGSEHIMAHQITDENGLIPNIPLPVIYDPSKENSFLFSTYNLRIQAENYYTQNLLDIRIFPNTITRFNIELIPIPAETSGEIPEQTIIIPRSPVDIINNDGGV